MLGCTQVFWPGVPKPVFFVASRGHHADIGGITPGSMPPHSKALREEGAVFVSFKLVKDGVFQEEGGSALGQGEHRRSWQGTHDEDIRDAMGMVGCEDVGDAVGRRWGWWGCGGDSRDMMRMMEMWSGWG